MGLTGREKKLDDVFMPHSNIAVVNLWGNAGERRFPSVLAGERRSPIELTRGQLPTTQATEKCVLNA